MPTPFELQSFCKRVNAFLLTKYAEKLNGARIRRDVDDVNKIMDLDALHFL